ncbi:hypothetical protein [Kitasatospora sp. NPDC057223]|uniref:hypothetical protein n=1 Tax=Kitasatospora sp. NPDC057223 TaxID=3346055 RepID=UPI00362F1AE5
MSTPGLQTEDAVVQSVLATLETHMQSMRTAGQNVEAVNGEIQQHFQAACSTAYQQRIADWQEKYRQLQQAYDTFHAGLARGHQGINNAHTEALGLGSGWSPGSNNVFNVLNGG